MADENTHINETIMDIGAVLHPHLDAPLTDRDIQWIEEAFREACRRSHNHGVVSATEQIQATLNAHNVKLNLNPVLNDSPRWHDWLASQSDGD